MKQFGIVADKVMHRSLKPNDVSSILTGPTFRKLEVGSSKFEACQTRVFILHTSHFKLPSFFDNLVVMQFCAHDVAVACCLAMAEVWVRLPLGALLKKERVGEWETRRHGDTENESALLSLSPCLLRSLSLSYSGVAQW